MVGHFDFVDDKMDTCIVICSVTFFSDMATVQTVVSKASTEFIVAESRVLLPSLSIMVHLAEILIRFIISLA